MKSLRPVIGRLRGLMRGLFFLTVLGLLLPAARAQFLVWSTGNNQTDDQTIANWLTANGVPGTITAYDGYDGTTGILGTTGNPISLSDLQGFQAILYFSNSNSSADPTALGNVLAQFANTGRRLVVATFAYADQGSNTLGGNFINNSISPVVLNGSSLYRTATMASNVGGPLFAGVNSITGYYRDTVTPVSGATVLATWSDGTPFVVSKGNVIAITLFPDAAVGDVSGDYEQLFANALTVQTIPEPPAYALLALGLALLGIRRGRGRRKLA